LQLLSRKKRFDALMDPPPETGAVCCALTIAADYLTRRRPIQCSVPAHTLEYAPAAPHSINSARLVRPARVPERDQREIITTCAQLLAKNSP
jgi:hypothetical protein